jgi:hypothetical protein
LRRGLSRWSRFESVRVVATMLVVVGTLYADVVFRGRSLLASDHHNFLDDRRIEANYGAGFVPASTWSDRGLLPWANLHDPGAAWWQWEPSARFFRRAVLSGESPVWDPYTGSGTPGTANLTGTNWFPPYLAVVLAGDGAGLRNAYYLLLQVAAGVFTALFARRNGMGLGPALFAGAAFVASGAMVQSAGSMIGQTLACLPWALHATARFLDRVGAAADDRSRRREVVLLALQYAAIALSSFVPVLVGVFLFSASYAAARLFRWPLRLGDSLRYVAAAAVGILLVSFLYVPFLTLAAEAADVMTAYREAYTEVLEPHNLLQLWSPLLLGGAKVLSSPWVTTSGPVVELAWVGGAVLVLALFARRLAQPLVGWSAAVVVCVAAKLVGLAPLQWLASMPPLRSLHFVPYFGMLLAFPLALLGGAGLHALLRAGKGGERAWERWGIALGSVAALAYAVRMAAARLGAFERPSAGEWQAEWSITVAITFGVLLASVLLLRSPNAVAAAGWRRAGGVLLVGCFAIEAWRSSDYPRPRRFGLLSSPAAHLIPLIEKSKLHLPGPELPPRAMGFAALQANAGSALGIFQVESLTAFNPARVRALYRRATASDNWLFLTEPRELPSEGFLSRAGVRWVLSTSRAPWFHSSLAHRPRWRKIFDDDYARVYERETFPRCFYTRDYLVTSAHESLRATVERAPDLALNLEETPSFPRRNNLAKPTALTFDEWGNDRLRLHFASPRRGLLYCADSYARGWTARVNGEPAKILAANFAFRAVEVPEGPVEVAFEYAQPGGRAGAVLSLAGLAVCGLLWVAPVRWRRRQG